MASLTPGRLDPHATVPQVDYEAQKAALLRTLNGGVSGRLRKLVRRLAALTDGSAALEISSRLARCPIRRSGLFDAAFYLDLYRDVAANRANPLNHYLQDGFAEGRFPNPLFETRWYLAENGDVRTSGLNPLLHYIRAGERENRWPNPWFDPAWYRQVHRDVAAAGMSPLRHYLIYGWREGRVTSEGFDGEAYLRINHDLDPATTNPLAHYIHNGRLEGRSTGGRPAARSAGGRASGFPAKPVDGGAHLAYVSDSGSAPGEGRYSVETGPANYAYIPPRRPDDPEAAFAGSAIRPHFSIVTPVYNVDPAFLARLVSSVKAQWYSHWELILLDDGSPRPDTRAFLQALDDPQIKVRLAERNGGIAHATNAALDLASGDYVVFLDHDDELTEDCLHELALRICATDADYLYSDEDKIDEAGRFSMPFFKPDWSPDAFMSVMYTCHVSCVRRELLDRVGRVRLGFDGAQDYDLILRVVEQARRIEHVPKVLYHWRTLATSVAAGMGAKPAAVEAAKVAKEDALRRRGLEGEVEPVPGMPGQFRINYRPRGAPLVSIVIPSKDNVAMLRPCVESLLAGTDYKAFEIVLMDNGSTDPATLAYLASLQGRGPIRRFCDDRPFNFSAINNLGRQMAKGDYLLFLNDDTEVIAPDWLERMLGYAQLDHVGAVGAKLLYPDGGVQHCGVVNLADGPGHAFLRSDPDIPAYFGRNVVEYDWLAVTAACLMVSRDKFDAVDGFDEDFPVAYNDVDLCFRLWKAGYYNVVCQQARLVHHESVSRGEDRVDSARARRLLQDWRRLYRKHPDLYMRDPFHSPNLHPHDVQFSLYAA